MNPTICCALSRKATKSCGRRCEPVAGDARRLLPLVAAHHVQERRGAPPPGPPRRRRGRTSPVVVGPVAVPVPGEVQEVEVGPLPGRPPAAAQPAHQVPGQRAVQGAVGVRVAPAQVGVQHLPGQVVREEPLRPLLDEREPPQPLEGARRALRAEDAGQEGLRGHPGVGADAEGPPVQVAGDALHEPLQERAHHVGGVQGAEGIPPAARHPRPSGRQLGAVLAAQEVRHQGEGQGVAVGKGQHRRVPRRGARPAPAGRPGSPGAGGSAGGGSVPAHSRRGRRARPPGARRGRPARPALPGAVGAGGSRAARGRGAPGPRRCRSAAAGAGARPGPRFRQGRRGAPGAVPGPAGGHPGSRPGRAPSRARPAPPPPPPPGPSEEQAARANSRSRTDLPTPPGP